jgi:hypothetical protein
MVGLLLAEIPPFYRFNKHRHSVISKLNFWNAIFATISIICGLILAENGTYPGEELNWHKYGGILYGVLSWIMAITYSKSITAMALLNVYRMLLGTLLICMVITAHFGGTMTHGKNFLTEPFQEKKVKKRAVENSPKTNSSDERNTINQAPESSPDLSQAPTPIANPVPPKDPNEIDFQKSIFPILETRCIQCHGPSKVKGELRVDNRANMIAGGSSGIPAIVPGDSSKSELIYRMELPKDDDDFMPPDGKEPATKEEIALIKKWIEQGAKWTVAAPLFAGDSPMKKPADNISGSHSLTTKAASRELQELIDSMAADGIIIKQAQWDKSKWIAIFSHYNKTIGVDQINKLLPFAKDWVELDFSDCQLEDSAWKLLPKFENLESLRLEESNVKNTNLQNLSSLQNLQYLNLFSTQVSNQIILEIEKLQKLQKIHVWNSKITKSGIDQLKAKKPNLVIIE